MSPALWRCARSGLQVVAALCCREQWRLYEQVKTAIGKQSARVRIAASVGAETGRNQINESRAEKIRDAQARKNRDHRRNVAPAEGRFHCGSGQGRGLADAFGARRDIGRDQKEARAECHVRNDRLGARVPHR